MPGYKRTKYQFELLYESVPVTRENQAKISKFILKY